MSRQVVTTTVREYDEEGRCVKETTTTCEYDWPNAYLTYPNYPYYPRYPQTTIPPVTTTTPTDGNGWVASANNWGSDQ